MFSEFLSFSFMGVSSNLEVFLSEKHLNDHNSQYPDSSLSLRPAMETLTLYREDNEIRQKQQELVQERDQEQHKEDHQEQQSNDDVPKNMPAPAAAPLGLNLKLEIPSYKEVEREELDDSNDGFKTPTSEEHKIPAVLQCPPAPRKPKTLPSTKRKGCRCRIAIDLTSQEIQSMFPTLYAVDLGAGGNNKKVKLFTES